MEKQKRDQRVEVVERHLVEAVRRLGLADRGVLAAVSGGADSLCLLWGLARLGVRLEAATVDHGLRAGSAAEVAVVEAQCRRLGVRFHAAAVRLESRSGVEAAARVARYAALERIRREGGLDVVATGHTATDQAETVLMRLGRGAALQGAAGIHAVRADGVVRPLLAVTRQETQGYVEALGLTPLADPMNADSSFTRVRVRRDVLPQLVAAVGTGAERALARFARLAGEDEALLAGLSRRSLALASLPDGSLDRVAVSSFERPIQRRVIAAFLEQASIPVDADLIESCLRSVEGGQTATLPHDRVLISRGGALRIERSRPRRKAGLAG